MSTLARYRAEKGETQAGFAARLGITQGFVSQLEKGRARPSLELAKRIEDATNGAVQMNSWFDALPSSETLAAE